MQVNAHVPIEELRSKFEAIKKRFRLAYSVRPEEELFRSAYVSRGFPGAGGAAYSASSSASSLTASGAKINTAHASTSAAANRKNIAEGPTAKPESRFGADGFPASKASHTPSNTSLSKAKDTQAASSLLIKNFEDKLQLLLNTRSANRVKPSAFSKRSPESGQQTAAKDLLARISETKRFSSALRSSSSNTYASEEDEALPANPYSSLISAASSKALSISPIRSNVLARHSYGFEDRAQHNGDGSASPIRPMENPFKHILRKKKEVHFV